MIPIATFDCIGGPDMGVAFQVCVNPDNAPAELITDQYVTMESLHRSLAGWRLNVFADGPVYSLHCQPEEVDGVGMLVWSEG